jgi:hypothetical protein
VSGGIRLQARRIAGRAGQFAPLVRRRRHYPRRRGRLGWRRRVDGGWGRPGDRSPPDESVRARWSR